MVTVAETAEPTFISFQPERSSTSLPPSSFCLTMRNGLKDITSDTLTASSGERTRGVTLWLLSCRRANHNVSLFISLAIHPDKIRIATGQIAGVDKDGRVRTLTNRICTFDFFTDVDEKQKCQKSNDVFCRVSVRSGAAASRSDLGQLQSVHAAGCRVGNFRARRRLSGLL